MNGNSTENGIVNVTVNVVLMFMQMFLLMLRLFSMFMVMLTCIFNVHVDDSHVHVALQNNHTRTESRAKASKGKKSKGKNKSDRDCLGDLPPMMLFLLFTSLSPIRHFSLPAPGEGDPQNHRFADLALHASGHRSAAALRNALQLAITTAPLDHEPSNARFIRLPDPTKGHNNAIQSPAAPPSAAIILWLRGELLVSHHASSRMPLPAHTARKHCSCFLAANSAFPYAPGSSPNTKRTSRRRSLKPKLHSTEPRRPIASPITVSKCQRPLFLTQLARPTPAQAMRVSPLPPSGSVLA